MLGCVGGLLVLKKYGLLERDYGLAGIKFNLNSPKQLSKVYSSI